MTPLDAYFEEKEEPLRGCLLALRDVVLTFDDRVDMSWKWRTPFFTFSDRMFCYLSLDKHQNPYLGFWDGHRMTHSTLLGEGRKQIKIMRFQADEDLPMDELAEVLTEASLLVLSRA